MGRAYCKREEGGFGLDELDVQTRIEDETMIFGY